MRIALVLGCASTLAFASSIEDATASRPVPCRLAPMSRGRRLVEREAPDSSTNWAGYAAATDLASPAPGSVTAVRGSWIVPDVAPSGSRRTYSAVWVGIDGYGDRSVEQIGTEQDWTPRGPVFTAWFEMYPRPAYSIVGFPVAPGDEISASVTTDGSGQYELTVTNLTQNQTFTTTQRGRRTKNASTEWIVEAPAGRRVLPLADFGETRMSRCEATIDGRTSGIDDPAWNFAAITMESKRALKATTSSLSAGGRDFLVAWNHE